MEIKKEGERFGHSERPRATPWAIDGAGVIHSFVRAMASFSSERESLLRGTTSEGRYRTTARESGDDAGESDDARGDYYSDDSHAEADLTRAEAVGGLSLIHI